MLFLQAEKEKEIPSTGFEVSQQRILPIDNAPAARYLPKKKIITVPSGSPSRHWLVRPEKLIGKKLL